MVSNKRSLKTSLDAFGSDDKPVIRFKLNGKLFDVKENLDVYCAEIEGTLPEDLSGNELFLVAASKLDAPAGRLSVTRSSVKQVYLVSTEKIPAISFTRSGVKFFINPQLEPIKLSIRDQNHRETIRQLAHASVKAQLTKMGFVHARTGYGRNAKDFIVKDDKAIEVHSQKGFHYHVFEAITFRVYWYEDVESTPLILVSLDTLRPVFKSARSNGTFSELIDESKELSSNVDGFVATEDLPESISDHVIHLRKCEAQERYNRAMGILTTLSIPELEVAPGHLFEEPISNKINYIKREPEFLFGDGKHALKPDQIFNEFLLDNLQKYGPYTKEGYPAVIKVKLVYMAQLPQRYREKMVDGLTRFKEQFEALYRIKLEFVGEGDTLLEKAKELPEVDSDVEFYCHRTLTKQFDEGEFDLVIDVLYGDQFNHPYRRAIKKGLQQVPSQTLKHPLFNAPKMFADIYKTSISSQLVYKSKGLVPTPIATEYLDAFKIRVYYDVGHKKLPGISRGDNRIFSIIGVVSLIVDDKIYKFNKELKVNDYSMVETTKGDIVRELLRLSITSYLDEKHLSKLDGNILVQRDGIFGVEEPGPALDEINKLREDGIIPRGTKWAFVEFIKDTPIRLFSHEVKKEPQRGTYFHLSQDRTFLTTTGYPDIHPKAGKSADEAGVGVARTLEIRRIASSDTSREFMMAIVQDVYYRSFLWNATFSKTRYIAEANMVHEIFDLSRQGVTRFPKWVC